MNGDARELELAEALAQKERQQKGYMATLKEQEDTREAMLFLLEDLEEARKKIERSNREWIAALDVIRSPIFLHDNQFRILRCNKAYQQCAGMEFPEIIGKPYFEVFPKLQAPMPCCLRAMEQAEPGEEELTVGEAIYRTLAFPVHDEQGKYLYSVHTLEEVTESKRVEEALRESEEKFRYLFEHSVVGMSMTLITGELNVNHALCEMLGYSHEELKRKKWQDVTYPDDIELTARAIKSLVSDEKKSVRFVMRFLHKNGSIVWSELSTSLRRDSLGKPLYLISSIIDITERKRSELALQRANRALLTLGEGNQALIRATDELQLLHAICRISVRRSGYRMAWVGFVQQDAEKSIRVMAQDGFDEGYLENTHFTWADNELGQGPAGRAARTGKIVIAQNIALDSHMAIWREEAKKRGYAANIALPLLGKGRCFGVLTIYAAEADAFDAEEISLLEKVAEDLSFGILTLRSRVAQMDQEQRLQKNMMQTVEAIAGIVEMRDPYTSGHQSRVAELARLIALQMGLSEEDIHAIHLAGLMHDLGKISIPAEILSKPAKLNDIEYSLIKMHPKAGYDILKGIDFSWPIAQMVLQHHERMDGSGYPQGLKGEEILLGARILAVADVVEAMSSHRPYRPGLGIDAALEEIIRLRSKHFDPQAVDACVALFREQGYALP